MEYTTRTINDMGLAEIRAILAKNHKLGGEHFTHSMILAWAADAQLQLDDGNHACIEIKARDHVDGFTQEFRLSTKAFDNEVVEIDE